MLLTVLLLTLLTMYFWLSGWRYTPSVLTDQNHYFVLQLNDLCIILQKCMNVLLLYNLSFMYNLSEMYTYSSLPFMYNFYYTPVFRRDVLWYGDVRPSGSLSDSPSDSPSVWVSIRPFSTLFSDML